MQLLPECGPPVPQPEQVTTSPHPEYHQQHHDILKQKHLKTQLFNQSHNL